MVAYIGGLTLGLIFALLALGLFVSYRVLKEIDLTAEGAFAFGACTAAALILAGWNPYVATLGAAFAGALAGLLSSGIAALLRLPLVLAGIVVSTMLISANVIVLRGQGNVPLLSDETPTLVTKLEEFGRWMFEGKRWIDLGESRLATGDVGVLVGVAVLAAVAVVTLWRFLKTHLGVALRASGDNPQMASSFGISPVTLKIIGLAVANSFAGLCGALVAQYTGFADFRSGVGVLVVGLASLLLGEAILGRGGVARMVFAAVVGAIGCRLAVVVALNEFKLAPNLLNLVVGGMLLVVLALPLVFRRRRATA
jgi:putative ABC transport system permease protein